MFIVTEYAALSLSYTLTILGHGTVMILEELCWFGNLEDNATTSLNRLNL